MKKHCNGYCAHVRLSVSVVDSAFRYSILKQQMCMIAKTCPKWYTAFTHWGKNKRDPKMYQFFTLLSSCYSHFCNGRASSCFFPEGATLECRVWFQFKERNENQWTKLLLLYLEAKWLLLVVRIKLWANGKIRVSKHCICL